MDKTDKYIIPSLARACEILRMIVGAGKSMSASEVARQLSIPRTTALRILHTLCREGLLAREGQEFRAGGDMFRLGLRALGATHVRELSVPVLRSLSLSTGETTHIAVLRGDKSLILEVYESSHLLHAAHRLGNLVPIHCSATGKVLLAFAIGCANLRDFLKDTELEVRTPNTITSIEGLEAECKRVVRQGYAVDNEEYDMGVRCLAAPVWDASGILAASIGVTSSTTTFTKRRIPEMAEQVRHAAETLSRSLGFQSKTTTSDQRRVHHRREFLPGERGEQEAWRAISCSKD